MLLQTEILVTSDMAILILELVTQQKFLSTPIYINKVRLTDYPDHTVVTKPTTSIQETKINKISSKHLNQSTYIS